MHAFLSDREENWEFVHWSDIIHTAKLPSKGCIHFRFKPVLYESTYFPFVLSTIGVIDVYKFCQQDEEKNLIFHCLNLYFLVCVVVIFSPLQFNLCFDVVSSHSKFHCSQDFPSHPSWGCRWSRFTSNKPCPVQSLEHSQYSINNDGLNIIWISLSSESTYVWRTPNRL